MRPFIHHRTAAAHSVCAASNAIAAAAVAAHRSPGVLLLQWRRPPRPLPTAAAAAAAADSDSTAEYSFASAGSRREPGARRNRTAEKRATAELSSVVRGLVTMTPKQLAAVSHLLTDAQIEEIGLAARLPRNNQGRKRHENRVAALLRAEADADAAAGALAKLCEAVALAQAGGAAALFVDADAADLVDGWVAALRGGDARALEDAAAAVGSGSGSGGDVDALRRLAAELAAPPPEPAAAAAAAAGGASSINSGGGGGAKDVQVAESVLSDPELLALLTQPRRGKGGGKGSGGAGGGGGSGQRRMAPMAPAEKKLRALLRPAALRVLKARRESGGDDGDE